MVTLFDCSPKSWSSPLLSLLPLYLPSGQSDGVLVNSLSLAQFHRNPLYDLKDDLNDEFC